MPALAFYPAFVQEGRPGPLPEALLTCSGDQPVEPWAWSEGRKREGWRAGTQPRTINFPEHGWAGAKGLLLGGSLSSGGSASSEKAGLAHSHICTLPPTEPTGQDETPVQKTQLSTLSAPAPAGQRWAPSSPTSQPPSVRSSAVREPWRGPWVDCPPAGKPPRPKARHAPAPFPPWRGPKSQLGSLRSSVRPGESRSMSEEAGAVDKAEVASEGPQKTHIDVHLHQESALAKILECGWSLLKPAKATPKSRAQDKRLLVASWVMQIVLGVLSVVLGGVFYLFPFNYLQNLGVALWTGITALLTGVVTFIHDRRGGTCWALLRTLLALTSFSMAIAAIVLGGCFFWDFTYRSYRSVCELRSESRHWPTGAPTTLDPELEYRKEICQSYERMLQHLTVGIESLLLGIWILLLLASMTPLGLYCWRKLRTQEKTDQLTPLQVSGI